MAAGRASDEGVLLCCLSVSIARSAARRRASGDNGAVSRLRLSPVALRPGLAAGLPFSGAGETITLDYWGPVERNSLLGMRELGGQRRIHRHGCDRAISGLGPAAPGAVLRARMRALRRR